MPTTVDCMVQAQQHKGASVIECLVNCVIFNNGTHSWITDRETRADRTIILRHGEKMVFGKDSDKGIALVTEEGALLPHLAVVPADDPRVLTHDATLSDPTLHRMLALMGQDLYMEAGQTAPATDLPIALGVIRNVEEDTYDRAVNRQIADVQAQAKIHTFDELLGTLEQWEG